jgi:hypothetical protein
MNAMANAVLSRSVAHVEVPAAHTSELCDKVRSYGVVLTLVPTSHGVVLEGISPTFYGKQMAQELARQARLVVVANRIHVDRKAGSADRALASA